MPRTTRWALAAILALAAGCNGGSRRPEQPRSPATPDSRAAEEAADRAELVLPAPYFWRPATPEAELKLTLVLEKTTLKIREKIRYRLELQNTGGKDVFFSEDPSFIKFGNNRIEYHAYLTEPGKSEKPLPGPFSLGGRMLTVDEIRERGPTNLRLTLHSGETLVSRPDQPASNRFRNLKTLTILRHPGRHRVRFVYDRAGDARLRAESNVVEFDVVP